MTIETRVYVSLMFLLALTVGVSLLPLGIWGVVTGLLIAAIKAFLVIWFFMELRNSPPLVRLVAAAGMLWVGLLMVLIFGDYLTRGTIHVLGK